MNLAPLNANRSFEVWPSFSPGEWIDFNPTLVTLGDGKKIALVRRDRFPPIPGEGSIWAVPLDNQLRPIGNPEQIIARGEDPRGVVIGSRLFVFFDIIEKDGAGAVLGSSMMLMELDASKFPPAAVRLSSLPKNPTDNHELRNVRWEKNWVPFVATNSEADSIALIYSHDPWTVLVMDVSENSGKAPPLSTAFPQDGISWPYGETRGGPPPLRFNENSLITFFHSAQVIGSRNCYMTGACVFDDSPPYTPRLMTVEPLLVAPYRSTVQRFGWPVLASVIFPLGAIEDNNQFKLLCGIDDGEIGSILLTREEVVFRLKPILKRKSKYAVGSTSAAVSLPEGPVVLTPSPESIQGNLPLARYLGMLPQSTQTFLDIGADAGLFSVHLSNNYSKVISINLGPDPWLPRNIALNSLGNVHIDTPEVIDNGFEEPALGDIGLIRINLPDTRQILNRLHKVIDTCSPLILIHLSGATEDLEFCADFLLRKGYSVDAAFPLMPQVVICTKEQHRKLCPWLF